MHRNGIDRYDAPTKCVKTSVRSWYTAPPQGHIAHAQCCVIPPEGSYLLLVVRERDVAEPVVLSGKERSRAAHDVPDLYEAVAWHA